MEQTLSEKSNSIQFLFIFHVSIYFHHSVNFHFRNKQLFIVHRKDNGRYNDPLFSPSTVQFFFKNSLLFEAFKWLSFKYHSKSLWSILGQSQYLTFPKHTDWVRKRWMCSYWWSEVKSLSCIRLFATPWTVAYHAPPSMGFSRQEYWSRLSFPSSEDLPNSGIKPGSPGL